MTTTLAAAWANRATAPVPMLHVGDSVTEGTGAGGFEAKYATKLLRSLQGDAGITGGPGFVNSGSYVPTDNSLSSFYSPVGSVSSPDGLLGSRSGNFATNQAVTITWTGTSLSLHFYEYSAGQPFTVSIDGGAAASVTTANGTADSRGVWHTPTLTRGTHTALLTPPSGGQIILRGIHVYDGDEGKGVHGWEGGHYGDQTSAQAGSPASYFADACAVIQPAVATLLLGLNDWQAGVSAATYQANLTAIINAVNGYCTTPPSWVICGIYRRTDVASPAVALSAYTAAAQAVVNADPANRRFVDLNTVSISLSPDNVHPNATGHAAIAAAIRPAVLDLAGGAAPSWASLVAERWTGSAWTPLTVEKWDGSAWVSAVLERAP
jgi:lysophospholipase L1-like esterase